MIGLPFHCQAISCISYYVVDPDSRLRSNQASGRQGAARSQRAGLVAGPATLFAIIIECY